jgi:hypothetical protein
MADIPLFDQAVPFLLRDGGLRETRILHRRPIRIETFGITLVAATSSRRVRPALRPVYTAARPSGTRSEVRVS